MHNAYNPPWTHTHIIYYETRSIPKFMFFFFWLFFAAFFYTAFHLVAYLSYIQFLYVPNIYLCIVYTNMYVLYIYVEREQKRFRIYAGPSKYICSEMNTRIYVPDLTRDINLRNTIRRIDMWRCVCVVCVRCIVFYFPRGQ